MAHVFKFSLENPLLKGTLFKKGRIDKLFKRRFFVLYPGFLVYYDDVDKWKTDVWKGNTLGGRVGGVYLKDANCNSYIVESKRLHCGISLYSPDKRNKHKHLEMCALDAEEQETWIAAIRQAIPQVIDHSERALNIDAGSSSSLTREAVSRESTPDQRASLEISGSSCDFENSFSSPQRHKAISAEEAASDSSGVGQQTVLWSETKVGFCINVVNTAAPLPIGNELRNDDSAVAKRPSRSSNIEEPAD